VIGGTNQGVGNLYHLFDSPVKFLDRETTIFLLEPKSMQFFPDSATQEDLIHQLHPVCSLLNKPRPFRFIAAIYRKNNRCY
jgi:hypothetical protein